MLVKLIIVIFLLFILASLGSGLYYLVHDRSQSDRAAKALTIRIALSLALFVLLLIAFATGLITPHGVHPGQSRAGGPDGPAATPATRAE